MVLEITEYEDMKEKSFEILNHDDEGYERVYVHPWSRKYRGYPDSNEVYLSVGVYTPEGDAPDDTKDNYWNIIVNREDFVEGLIQTFPELKRVEGV